MARRLHLRNDNCEHSNQDHGFSQMLTPFNVVNNILNKSHALLICLHETLMFILLFKQFYNLSEVLNS